jgi:hypothetical protein
MQILCVCVRYKVIVVSLAFVRAVSGSTGFDRAAKLARRLPETRYLCAGDL